MKIFVLSPNKEGLFSPNLLKELEGLGEIVFETLPKPITEISGLFEEGEKILAPDPDFFEWNFPSESLKKIPGLKAIVLPTTSFSWLDTSEAARLGIPVTNLRGFSTEAVAEYVLMMTLSLARKMPIVVKDGYKQDFVKHQGIELRGKTAAVIGLGRIGMRIAELMQGIGMKVVYWSKHKKDTFAEYQELSNIFQTADIVFPTMAQNEESKGLITDAMLRSMPATAMLVSIAHKIYNHELLLELVKDGKVYGYAFEGDNESPIAYEGNVFASPAVAWATNESMSTNGRMWVDSLSEAVKGVFSTKIN